MVIVIGNTHHNTLSIIRCLGQKGVKLDLILCENININSYISYSKYINRQYTNVAKDHLIDLLKTNYRKNHEKSILINCSDDVTSILDSHYEDLSGSFSFFNAGQKGIVTRYMDKQLQVELAQESGLKVPQSIIWQISNSRPEFEVYPCIVKPLQSIHGGKKFNVCNDINELGSVLENYEAGDVVQIQEFINREYEIVIDGVSLKKEIIVPGYIEKIRDFLGGTTYSVTHPISELPSNILHSIHYIINKIEYVGLFGVELIISNGLYYFVEINLRNDATTYSIAQAGVNLPYIYVQDMSGVDYQNEKNHPIRKIHSIVEFRDIGHVFRFQLNIFRWLKQLNSSQCTYYYDKEDIKPYYVAKKQYINELLGLIGKKLHLI